MIKLSREIKIALAKNNTTLKEWADKKGFKYSTVFSVAAGIIPVKRKGTKSYEIKEAIEKELLGR